MKKAEAWQAKVADLKRFAEESLRQMEEDKEYLLRVLKDLEDSLEILQRFPLNQSITLMKYSSIGPPAPRMKAGEFSAREIQRGERIDLHKILADQREKIPTYRSVISRFDHIGTLLKTCLKRISEAESLMR